MRLGIRVTWGPATIVDNAEANTAFEFTVQTDNAGTSADNQFTIPITSATPYNISTSDGQSITGATGATTLTFPSAGTYTVSITDSCEGWRFNNGGDKLKLLDISNWGVFRSTISATFYGATNMTCSAVDAPINAQSILTNCFRNCVNFNGAIGNWDVSQVTQFNFAFYQASNFNQPLADWDVSNGQQFDFMFDNTAFNQPIGNWNTSNALDMQGMFTNGDFNQNIDSWDVSNVTNMYVMFKNNTVFNQPLNSWNTSSVTNFRETFSGATLFNGNISSWTIKSSGSVVMREMFRNATAFNQPIGSWTMNAVGDVQDMFNGASAFNQDIGSWNLQSVSSFLMNRMFQNATSFNNGGQPMLWNMPLVTSFDRMFDGATSFNADISSWNVSNVTNFAFMFEQASSFNQPIGSWTTTSATNMNSMFDGPSGIMAFNQDISSWDVSGVTGMANMFRNCRSFNQPLASWNTASLQSAQQLFFECDAFDFANVINWDIVDVTNLINFMYQVPDLSTATYDAILVSWEAQLQTAYPGGVGYTPTISISFNGSQYTLGGAAETARTSLVNNYGWTITDGGGVLTNESYLVASYNFDSDFTDYTGNHPLTPSGTTPPVAGVSGGVVNNCAEFNSTGDYTLTADSDDFSFTDGVSDLPFSISFWANFTSYNSSTGTWFFSKRDDSTNEEWQILNLSNEFAVVLFSGGGNSNRIRASLSYPPPIGSWHHYAVTYDGSATFAGIKIYIDGVSQTLTNTSAGTYVGMINGTQNLNIGSQSWNPGNASFWGKMDETHIWKNRELTAAEVLGIYNTENAGNSIL